MDRKLFEVFLTKNPQSERSNIRITYWMGFLGMRRDVMMKIISEIIKSLLKQ